MSTQTPSELPLWDLTPFFPSLESPEFDNAFAAVAARIDELVELFDAHGIGADPAARELPAIVAAFEAAISAFDELIDASQTVTAFLYGLMSIDTRDEAPQIKLSELDQRSVPLAKLSARLTAWIGMIDVDALLAASPIAREHAYLLRREQIDAAHQMSPAEENLAAELRTSSGNAWSRLQENVSAQAIANVAIDGEIRAMPMPEARLLAYDPDRQVREAAYRAELTGWEAVEVPIAAALNSVKGESITLARRRKWESTLDVALHRNAIDREILDSMLAEARVFFVDARAYFAAKARLLGIHQLAWFDLFAPIPGEAESSWSYERSRDVIESTFAGYSPRLGGLARRAFAEDWVDARPRAGKGDGAYCSAFRADESRIFMNFTPSYGGVSTLAHELGHAYHNVAVAHRPAIQRDSPSTLAETASIFCETLLRQAAVRDASPREELAILEGSLQDAAQTIVDITSRFLFEQRFCERRVDSELPVSEINDLMLTAQQETYGDGLASDALHPYMWAAKGHYYSVDHGFYNFPYMFGLLFGLGLYQQFRAEPVGFPERYDSLLSSTGRADASELAAGFGIDLRAPAFWRASFDLVRADIARYVELVDEVSG